MAALIQEAINVRNRIPFADKAAYEQAADWVRFLLWLDGEK